MDEHFRPVPKPKKKKKKYKNIPKKIRAYVKKRDKHQCVICGESKDLQLHHIVTKGRYDPQYYTFQNVHDPKNLATVCPICHRQIHDDPDMMKYMLGWQKINFGNIRKES